MPSTYLSLHVHLLIGLPATVRLPDVMREAKAMSPRWVHEEIKEPGFTWQEGYGAFSVRDSQRDDVRVYIERWEEHHRRRTFQEEYEELLRRSGVSYDPKHLW